MSQMEKPSAYVSRCCEALEKYSALRFTGVSHDGAVQLSGLIAAVTSGQQPAKEQRDVRQLQTGEKD